jgi:hypothetical protein
MERVEKTARQVAKQEKKREKRKQKRRALKEEKKRAEGEAWVAEIVSSNPLGRCPHSQTIDEDAGRRPTQLGFGCRAEKYVW